MVLLTLLLLASDPVKPLPPLSAPLGRLGPVVDAPPTGGTPGEEKILQGKFEGCDRVLGLYLTKLVSGTLLAVGQLQDWLNRTPGLEKKLFAKGKLGEVVKLVSGSAAVDRKACIPPTLVDGYKLELLDAGAKLCPAEKGWRTGDFWWLNGTHRAAVIALTAAPEGAANRCLPRFSVVLFDKNGVARIRLHADWGGSSAVSIVGDRCKSLDFTFDGDTQTFVPTWSSVKGCKG